MQKRPLELNEIIWEITGRCRNGCKYCGSKEVWNNIVDNEKILQIVDAICKYPPKQIDISGGDPFQVDLNIHRQVIQKLKDKNVYCKILINPKSGIIDMDLSKNILSLYDWTGLSINTNEEINLAISFLNDIMPYYKNFTIITNFNISNIFKYNDIEEIVRKYNLLWTIQYTVYKDKDNDLAIYNNDSALKELENKINASIKSGTKILLSDNTNNGPCGAGISSIGLTFDGDVMPCLSMRSWELPRNQILYQGNILEVGLEQIWGTAFRQYRFNEFECCKDACKNKCLNIKNIVYVANTKQEDIIETGKTLSDILEEWSKNNPTKPQDTIVVMYAVSPGNVQYYGVTPNPFPGGTVAYAVYPPFNEGTPVYATRTYNDFSTMKLLYGCPTNKFNIDSFGDLDHPNTTDDKSKDELE